VKDKSRVGTPETGGRPLSWAARADWTIAALIGAIVGGRMAYVLPILDTYSADPGGLLRFSEGGLGWHGLLIGGIAGLWVGWRLHRAPGVSFAALLDSIAPLIAGIALALWAGCIGGACGWGAEVTTLADYPAWAVEWARDVYGTAAPRYDTPLYGAALALAMLATALAWRGRGRFFAVVALAGAGMFLIGFWRGDPSPPLFGLRADQVADAVIAAWGAACAFRPDPN
jgi:phosphatidylglycerol---prolipoprotein diacylglyceryl transferase